MTKTQKEFSELLAAALGGRATKLSHCNDTFMIAGASVTDGTSTYKLLLRITDSYSIPGETFGINYDTISKIGAASFKVNAAPILRGILPDDHLYDTYHGYPVNIAISDIVADVKRHVVRLYDGGILRNQQRARSRASAEMRSTAKLNEYALRLVEEIGCTEHAAHQFVTDSAKYVKGAKIYDLAVTIAKRAISQNTVVGFTIANSDGTNIGEWRSWMTYFDSVDVARASAEDHIKFLNERGHTVVLAKLHASIG